MVFFFLVGAIQAHAQDESGATGRFLHLLSDKQKIAFPPCLMKNEACTGGVPNCQDVMPEAKASLRSELDQRFESLKKGKILKFAESNEKTLVTANFRSHEICEKDRPCKTKADYAAASQGGSLAPAGTLTVEGGFKNKAVFDALKCIQEQVLSELETGLKISLANQSAADEIAEIFGEAKAVGKQDDPSDSICKILAGRLSAICDPRRTENERSLAAIEMKTSGTYAACHVLSASRSLMASYQKLAVAEVYTRLEEWVVKNIDSKKAKADLARAVQNNAVIPGANSVKSSVFECLLSEPCYWKKFASAYNAGFDPTARAYYSARTSGGKCGL